MCFPGKYTLSGDVLKCKGGLKTQAVPGAQALLKASLSLLSPLETLSQHRGQAAPCLRLLGNDLLVCELFQKEGTEQAWDSGCLQLPALKGLSCPSPCTGVVDSWRLKCFFAVLSKHGLFLLPESWVSCVSCRAESWVSGQG